MDEVSLHFAVTYPVSSGCVADKLGVTEKR